MQCNSINVAHRSLANTSIHCEETAATTPFNISSNVLRRFRTYLGGALVGPFLRGSPQMTRRT
eukprot:2099078-Karenia_brevis.AAC.1